MISSAKNIHKFHIFHNIWRFDPAQIISRSNYCKNVHFHKSRRLSYRTLYKIKRVLLSDWSKLTWLFSCNRLFATMWLKIKEIVTNLFGSWLKHFVRGNFHSIYTTGLIHIPAGQFVQCRLTSLERGTESKGYRRLFYFIFVYMARLYR